MKLAHHLFVQLVVWSLLCAVVAAGYALHRTGRELRGDVDELLTNATQVLDLQIARIALGAELDASFPDWGLLDGLRVPAGACLRLSRADGSVWRSSCRGVDVTRTAPAPAWFAALLVRWRGFATTEGRSLRSPTAAPARIDVSLDHREIAARAWRDLRATTLVVLTVAGALALVAIVVVTRALRPARAILARIDSIERGDLSSRPEHFRFVELQRIASALERMAASLADALTQQRRLAAELIHVQEAERRRLARELHDEFGQSLAGIAALTGAVRSDVAAGRAPPAAELTRIAEAAAAMQQQLRELLARLGPAALDDLGLAAALTSLCADWQARCRGQPDFRAAIAADLPASLAPALAITAYRIAQAALTNAARHAQATLVTLRVDVVHQANGDALMLTVLDDGAPLAAPVTPGHGLGGMRERATALGGRLTWEALDGGGFRVRAELPLGWVDAI